MLRIVLAGALAVGLGYLPYRLSGPRGVVRALKLKDELARTVAENARLADENEQLLQRIERLKNDPRAIERVARDELGLVRPNDVIFSFE
jgi:cell division protein FtsB